MPKLPAWVDAFRLSLLSNQYPPLHGLRVIAIVSVLQFHVTTVLLAERLPIDAAFVTWSLAVWFGMDLFFLMSGFLIGTLILHALDRPGRKVVGRFYARRSFRTFPLYYVVLTALVVLFPTTPTQRASLPFEYAYLTNYHHFTAFPVLGWGWSLCVEEHFYLAVPLLMLGLAKVASHRGRLALLAVAWASGLAVRALLYALDGTWNADRMFIEMYLPTHTRFDILVAGIFLAYVQHSFRDRLVALFARRAVRVACRLVVIAGVVLLLLPAIWRNVPMTFLLRYDLFAWGTVTSVTYVALLLGLLNAKGWLQRALGHPAFLRIATLGYGIYLIHVPICSICVAPLARRIGGVGGVSAPAVWVISLAALLVLSALGAYALHVVVEKPFLALRNRVVP
jgi:peptidoglycan/LPS O-acetylase OafA/YrhL